MGRARLVCFRHLASVEIRIGTVTECDAGFLIGPKKHPCLGGRDASDNGPVRQHLS
jgi:hypothetical protein